VDARWLLRKLAAGHLQNVSFRDAVALVERFGFTLARVEGSHHIFKHPGVDQLLNLQEVRGDAKPYQLRQFLRLVERYNLKLDDQP
jgi:predicted RNA binding protein YcfA (HicA-like mRNA interferase family)